MTTKRKGGSPIEVVWSALLKSRTSLGSKCAVACSRRGLSPNTLGKPLINNHSSDHSGKNLGETALAIEIPPPEILVRAIGSKSPPGTPWHD